MTARALADLAAEHAAAADAGSPAAAARRAAVLHLRATGDLATAADLVVAATILADSDVAAEVEAAHTLALTALAADPRARPVAAAAYDRLRLLAGKPQKFGTQVVWREGRRELWPVDAGTTDSERAKWGVPGLEELRRRIANGA